MKRWLSLILSIILILGLCVPAMAAEELTEPVAPLPVEAEEAAPEVPEPAAAEWPEEDMAPPAEADEPMAVSSGTCGTGVTWDLTGGVLTISGSGKMQDYTSGDNFGASAPWGGQPITTVVINSGVTSIGNYAFTRCTRLSSVTIPSTVRSIGEGAFEQCRALTSVSLPGSLTTIGARAFSECLTLGSISVPDTVTSISNGAFAYCYALSYAKLSSRLPAIQPRLFAKCQNLATVTIPGPVEFISDSAFEGCARLSSITIPNTVTEIGNSTFQGCTSLKSMTIPASVQTVGGNAFADCTSLSSVTIAGASTEVNGTAFNNTPWSKAKGSFVIENGVLKTYQGAGGSVTIPSTVTEIGAYAFADRTDVTAVTIPSSVRTIGERAFMSSGVRKATISSGVRTIGAEAFLSCASLMRVSIPSTVTAMGDRAFFGCSALTVVNIPEGVRTIGAGCFRACVGLTTAVVPSTVTSIGEYAFAECRGLKDLVINGAAFTYGEDELFDTVTVYGNGSGTARQYASDMGVCYAVGWSGELKEPEVPDEPAAIQPPAGGTGWRYVPQTGDYYYFKDYVRKGDYWVGFADGASAWANNWYYADADGKLLTGLQYLDDLKGGKGWYMLQVNDANGEIGKMLDGWQWTYSSAGTGYFSPKYGSQGLCTYTTAWGNYNAATGRWGDGLVHRGS